MVASRTFARFTSVLLSLSVSVACSSETGSELGTNTTATGGSAGAADSNTTASGATTQAVSTGGSTATDTTGESAGSTQVTTTTVTRCGDATTGELGLANVADTSQTNTIVGATTITAGTASSFDASAVDLKLCFSVVGSVALTSVSGVTIDSASISGGSVNYTNLSGTTLTLESTNESNRYCIVFDVGSAAGSSVTVSGATAITYSWRFNKKSVDVGLMFDPRAKNAPELKAVLNGVDAACQVVSS